MATDLKAYLDYYSNLERPGYAVLVRGAWGVGKTFQVKKALGSDRWHADRYWHVSLFGLQTTSEIVASIFAAMFPAGAKLKSVAQAARDISIFGHSLGGGPDVLVRAVLQDRVSTDRVLVLDDMERCAVTLPDLLGVINRYVETHGCRVVVIAHDEVLGEAIDKRKEKVFGHTVEVVPQIEDAYDAFARALSRSPGDPHRTLGMYKSELLFIFRNSEVRSLRILRHVMEDTIRVFEMVSDEKRRNADAMSEFVQTMAALNCHVRSGDLQRENIQRRMRSRYDGLLNSESKPKKKIPMRKVQDRHPTVDIYSDLVKDCMAERFLCDGIPDHDAVEAAFSTSRWFRDPKQTPAWQRIWQFHNMDDVVLSEAIREVEDRFRDRDYSNPGEIKHVFAIRLQLAFRGAIAQSVEDVQTECRSFVDDLRSEERLPPLVRGHDLLIRGVHDPENLSVGYWVYDLEKEVLEVFEYFETSRSEASNFALKARTRDLLQVVENEPDSLFGLLNHTADGAGEFTDFAILPEIAAVEFVNAWLASHPSGWQSLASTLMARWENGRREAERRWIREVVSLLEAEAGRRTGLRAHHLRLLVTQIRAKVPPHPKNDGPTAEAPRT